MNCNCKLTFGHLDKHLYSTWIAKVTEIWQLAIPNQLTAVQLNNYLSNILSLWKITAISCKKINLVDIFMKFCIDNDLRIKQILHALSMDQSASVMCEFSASRHFFETNVTQSVAKFYFIVKKHEIVVIFCQIWWTKM